MSYQICAYLFTGILHLLLPYVSYCGEGSEKDTKEFLCDWGSESRNIVWVAWDKVYELKDKGDLGVIDIRRFNFALLGKWI